MAQFQQGTYWCRNIHKMVSHPLGLLSHGLSPLSSLILAPLYPGAFQGKVFQKDKPQCTNMYQASDCIMLPNVPWPTNMN